MCNMFAFHKPKIYRSIQGCCICRAKSSSSRFTDSKKYEVDFKQCFKLGRDQKRSGEICNACVLLIKRWKKLPKGTERNWNHVVDARAGPGNKAMLKNRMKSKVQATENNGSPTNKKQRPSRPPVRIRKMRLMDTLNVEREGRRNEVRNMGLKRTGHSPPSPTPSDLSDDAHDGSNLGEGSIDPHQDFPPSVRDILDINCWRMEKICCGTIFKGPRGEVLVDPHLLKPCRCAIYKPTYSTAVTRTNSDQIVPNSEHTDQEWKKDIEWNKVTQDEIDFHGSHVPKMDCSI
ncbi:SIN3-HDAC complex-associated factor-like [Anneissia japonica]|uniref:SIN3-HDAC complex-associated factor-like n=1 Tax=Anneissia japonica TaxID=1529436 RepID=UPI0014259732|nr:SIN3-HDAC complex-associated factor-like [Anneissia japonica]